MVKKRKAKPKKVHMNGESESVSLRVKHEVLAWFRAKGPGAATRMNEALQEYMWARK